MNLEPQEFIQKIVGSTLSLDQFCKIMGIEYKKYNGKQKNEILNAICQCVDCGVWVRTHGTHHYDFKPFRCSCCEESNSVAISNDIFDIL